MTEREVRVQQGQALMRAICRRVAVLLALIATLGGITLGVARAAGAGLHRLPPAASVGTVFPAQRHAANSASPAASVHIAPAHMPFYVATRGPLTIYLLGTLHIGDPSDYPPGQPFRRPILGALQASPQLALELSPDDMVAAQQKVSVNGVCGHACLPRLLPAPLWAQLRRRLRGNPAALGAVRQMRPWLASLILEGRDAQAAGLQSEYGTEDQLEDVYLRHKGARIVGLETLDQQMRAFTRLTLPQQDEMLAQDLAQSQARNVADIRVLHQLWRAGDADALAAWSSRQSTRLARSEKISEQIDEQILYTRNRHFATRMMALATPDHPLFVAIGALHLGGPRGVLSLLRAQSFQIESR